MNDDINSKVYAAMQTGKPYKTYKKTILGKASVKILNPFSQKPEEVILQGNPKKNEEGCFVDVWSEMEDVFLKRSNVSHIKRGVLIPFDRESTKLEPDVNKYNVLTDEELYDLLSNPFFKLQNALNKMTSPAPVYRLLSLAEEEEKSVKIVNAIKGRLAEIQEQEFKS